MPKRKAWTVLIWIAADNDLTDFGGLDIAEMKRVGSTADIDVVVQYDPAGAGGTCRYHLRKGTKLEADKVKDLGETNTGDPDVAIDFFTWGMKSFPSDHVMCVLWNHGSGIDETDVYARVRRGVAEPVPRGRASVIANSGMGRALFSTTVDAAVSSKAIAFDDNSRDFLDNAELGRVISTVVKRAGRRIDALGFDACLMNMIEVAYQLRGKVDFLIGSEEVEPGNGWPYDKVIRAAAKAPPPAKLAASIVKSYVASYVDDPAEAAVTQSALHLANVEATADAVDRLASAVLANLQSNDDVVAFDRSVRSAQRYYMSDFADLGDLCRQLVRRWPSADVVAAAKGVLGTLVGANGLVHAAESKGDKVARSTGTAIYFPVANKVHLVYPRLDFAQATRWPELIDRYNTFE
jgi:hypothetical protein